MVHVVFGINKSYSDGTGRFWFPEVGGIGYWNEDRSTFSNNINALNPYNHPDSELEENYSLIGWTQYCTKIWEMTSLNKLMQIS